MPPPPTPDSNPAILRECLTTPILRKAILPAPHISKKKPHVALEVTKSDASELSDFIDYLSQELFSSLPPALKTLTPTAPIPEPLGNLNFLPPELLDSLVSYDMVDDAAAAERLLREVIGEYSDAACAPPPVWSHTRPGECEMCERAVPLTYHHLVPKETHKKVLKRGWHEKWVLDSVAWLCRPCHSFVHRVATNEELARDFYTVEKLMDREDVAKWAAYVGRQRWKGV